MVTFLDDHCLYLRGHPLKFPLLPHDFFLPFMNYRLHAGSIVIKISKLAIFGKEESY